MPASTAITSLALLVKACLSECNDLEPALRRWEEHANFDELDNASIQLLPYLYRRLEKCEVIAQNHGRIKGIYTRSWYLYNTQANPTRTLLAELQDDKHRFLILDATSLQQLLHHDDPAARPSRGIDILVIADEAGAWGEALKTRGYQSISRYSLRYLMTTRKSSGWAKDGIQLGMHWRFTNFSLDADIEKRVFDRSIPLMLGTHIYQSPCLADLFLHSVLNRSSDAPTMIGLWGLDACLLARDLTPSDWDIIVSESRKCGWRTPILKHLIFLQETFQAPIPTSVIAQITRQKRSLIADITYAASQQRNPRLRRINRLLYAGYGLRRN